MSHRLTVKYKRTLFDTLGTFHQNRNNNTTTHTQSIGNSQYFLMFGRAPAYSVRLGYCFTPYQRLWLYNGAPLVAFYDTLGIRRTYSRLKPPGVLTGAAYSVGPVCYNRLKPDVGKHPLDCLHHLYDARLINYHAI